METRKTRFKDIDNILFVFIIRDLEPWLKSMYKTPYHLKINRDKNKFLTTNLLPQDKRLDNNVHYYPNEINKTILELRYYKINLYRNIIKKLSNAVIINLDYVQKDLVNSL
tara:strand:- start:4878 stop:5210 length:333 start_codon:yes stop_codon:yes gene_type:complete